MIIYFIVYSFIGWLYESTICSLLKYKKVINRGFLKGPYCPIYGYGALMTITLIRTDNVFLIFTVAMLLSTLLEYFTAVLLEKVFQRKWWDYSHFPLNIKGRVCIYASLIFGTANVLLVKFVHPVVESMVSGAESQIILSAFIVVIVGIDTIYFIRKHYSLKDITDTLHTNKVIIYDFTKETHRKIKNRGEQLVTTITEHIR